MSYTGSFSGLAMFKDTRGICKKRYVVIKIGNDIYVHPKTYKRLCRYESSREKFTRIIKKLKIKCALPKLDLNFLQPLGVFADKEKLIESPKTSFTVRYGL